MLPRRSPLPPGRLSGGLFQDRFRSRGDVIARPHGARGPRRSAGRSARGLPSRSSETCVRVDLVAQSRGEGLDRPLGVVAGAVEAPVDEGLHPRQRGPEHRSRSQGRRGHREGARGPGQQPRDRGDHDRVDPDEQPGHDRVRRGPADDPVDVVEVVAQDRDARRRRGMTGQRGGEGQLAEPGVAEASGRSPTGETASGNNRMAEANRRICRRSMPRDRHVRHDNRPDRRDAAKRADHEEQQGPAALVVDARRSQARKARRNRVGHGDRRGHRTAKASGSRAPDEAAAAVTTTASPEDRSPPWRGEAVGEQQKVKVVESMNSG